MSSTVFEAFAATARAHADDPFLAIPARADRDWLPAGQEFSYGDIAAEVEAMRARYGAAGYGPGHRVALLLENRPEFFVHYLALNALGAGIVPINPDYRHDELAYLLDHSQAALVVALPHRVADLARAGAAGAQPPAVVDVFALPRDLPAPSTEAPHRELVGRKTECALLYTSGTTGRPKGCVLTNHYFLTAGRGYLAHGGLLEIGHARERFYNPLPLYHMNHLAVCATGAIVSANCLILPERFSPGRWWAEVADNRATIIHYLGIVAPMLLNQPACAEEKQHRVRLGVGAGVEPELHAAFEARFGFPLIEVWGMTETGRVFADNFAPRRIGTRAFGRPYPGLEARVVDGHGADVAAGQDGELLVRHSAATPRDGFFSGYLANEAATEEAWRGGWFHTGDVVRADAGGMLHFVDRMKHIIRRSGENIAAAEIEAVLQAHAAVRQVAVVACPDELREEEVMACVVTMAGAVADLGLARELAAWCNARIAYYKVPGWVVFMDALPTTGTQKIQKGQIFAAGEDPRRHPGAIDLRALKKRG